MRGGGGGWEDVVGVGCFIRAGGSTRAAGDSGPAHHERIWGLGARKRPVGNRPVRKIGTGTGAEVSSAYGVGSQGWLEALGSLVARKTPHRFRPKTPESASPLGEGEDAESSGREKRKTGGSGTPPLRKTRMRTRRGGSTRAAGDSGPAHHERIWVLDPRGWFDTTLRGLLVRSPRAVSGLGARKRPVGDRPVRKIGMGTGLEVSSACGVGSQGWLEALGSLVARKTPHRFRPKTPESASPLGEGEDAESSGREKRKTGGSETAPLREARMRRGGSTRAAEDSGPAHHERFTGACDTWGCDV